MPSAPAECSAGALWRKGGKKRMTAAGENGEALDRNLPGRRPKGMTAVDTGGIKKVMLEGFSPASLSYG